jgi:GH43 family beta-xylosidase
MTAELPTLLVPQRADPWLYLHDDGYYYFTASVPEYDRIELRRARSLCDLASAEAVTVWRKHSTGPMGAHIWAPEIHFIDGAWYLYFAAGEAEKVWDIRIYVLSNTSANPLEGEWTELGQLKTQFESFALDATTFQHGGTRYLVWAQHNPQLENNTSLYIAPMDTPSSIGGPQVEISVPELEWEQRLYKVNEGPAVLKRNGRIFISYSASGTNHHYCMGLLTAEEDADLLDPASWKKSPEPVFCTDEPNNIFGPGHNSFTTLPDGTTDVFVFHYRPYKEIVGDPLYDPNRHAYAKAITWTDDGRPQF